MRTFLTSNLFLPSSLPLLLATGAAAAVSTGVSTSMSAILTVVCSEEEDGGR